MAKVMPAGHGQVNFIYTGSSLPYGAEVTFGFDHSTYGGTIDALAAEFHDAWCDNTKALMVTTCAVSSTLIKYGPAATGSSYLYSLPTSGTIASPGASPAVAILGHKNTALGGRAGRGRFFQPGVSEAHVDTAGNILGTMVTLCTTSWETFRTRMETFGVHLEVLHEDTAPVTEPTNITSLSCDARCATQRRRNRR